MTDVLIRNVPPEDLERIDVKAERLGLSRSEYLRRAIAREAAQADHEQLTMEHFKRLAELTADIADEEVMRQAWS